MFISFDLNKCIDRAQAIVIGELDSEGALLVTRIIRQDENKQIVTARRITLKFGQHIYTALNHSEPAAPTVEVAVFLREEPAGTWDAFQGYAGAVRLEPSKIFIFQNRYVPASARNAQIAYNRSTFIETLFRAESLRAVQQKLLQKPRTLEQVRRVIDFLLQNTRPEIPVPRFTWIYRGDEPYHSTVVKPGLHFGKIVHYFQPPNLTEGEMVANRVYRQHLLQYLSSTETELLLDRLSKAQTAEQRIVLLQLMGQLAIHPRYFKRLTHWTTRLFPKSVRNATFCILSNVDQLRAAEFLTRYFNWEDPELAEVLQVGCYRRSSYEQSRSLKVVDALEKLVLSLPGRPTGKNHYLLYNPEVVLLLTLSRYAHPRLLGRLSSENRNNVLVNFWSLHRLKPEIVAQGTKEAWWQAARNVLLQEYDLKSATGRKSWFDAYHRVDAATQRILMGLWWYEPQRDIDALLAATHGADSDAAKAVLAELWQNKDLPVKARQAIIAKFAKARLVQVKPLRPGVIELRVALDVDFPLPQSASVYSSHVIAFDGQPARMKKESTKKIGYLSRWSENNRWLAVTDRGQKIARAALLLVEKDYSDTEKDLWRQPIQVDSLRLEHIETTKE